MKRILLSQPQYKWILIMLLLAALIVAVFIYYNRRLKNIDDQLKHIPRAGLVSGE